MDLDLAKELGTSDSVSAQRLTLYLPNKDRDGALVDGFAEWLRQGQQILTQMGGGATALPPVEGSWRKPDGSTLWEETRLIYTYVDPDGFAERLKGLRAFLHRFGRETNQGEVVVEFDNRLYRIRAFDAPEASK